MNDMGTGSRSEQLRSMYNPAMLKRVDAKRRRQRDIGQPVAPPPRMVADLPKNLLSASRLMAEPHHAHICAYWRHVSLTSEKPPVDAIKKWTALETGVSLESMVGNRRFRPMAHARQLAMFRLHRLRQDLSLPAIGRHLGGKDHTTVLHAIRKAEREEWE